MIGSTVLAEPWGGTEGAATEGAHLSWAEGCCCRLAWTARHLSWRGSLCWGRSPSWARGPRRPSRPRLAAPSPTICRHCGPSVSRAAAAELGGGAETERETDYTMKRCYGPIRASCAATPPLPRRHLCTRSPSPTHYCNTAASLAIICKIFFPASDALASLPSTAFKVASGR